MISLFKHRCRLTTVLTGAAVARTGLTYKSKIANVNQTYIFETLNQSPVLTCGKQFSRPSLDREAKVWMVCL